MADQALTLATGLVSLVDKVETVFKKVFERKDIAEDNADDLRELKRLYNALNVSIERLRSMTTFINAAVQPLLNYHCETVRENLKLIDELTLEATNQGVTSRIRRMRERVNGLKTNAAEIIDFVRNEATSLPQHAETVVSAEHYVPDNNVTFNPPRLSLNYDEISTSEGKLKSAVLEDNGSKVVGIVAHGLGGVGKTCALRGLAQDADIQKRFPGGTLYIQLGNVARVSTVIQGIVTIVQRTGGKSLVPKLAGAENLKDAVDRASLWFRPHTCLFLIDDIWWVNGIDSDVLSLLGTMVNERSRVVYTTRDGKFLRNCDRQINFTARETHGDPAREILLTHGGFDWRKRLSDKNEKAVKGILEACQGLPVALGVAGETVYTESQLRKGPSEDTWSDLNNVIKSRLIDQDVAQYGSVRLIADTSLTILDSRCQEKPYERMFRALCVVEKQQLVPMGMLRNLWGLEDLRSTMDAVNQFHDVCIVRKVVLENAKVFVQLHDLILEIAICKASEKGEVEDIFQNLVCNYVSEITSSNRNMESKRSPQDTITRVEGPGRNKMLRTLRKVCCLGNGVKSGPRDKSQMEGGKGAVESDRGRVDWWRYDDGDYLHDNLCRMLKEAGYEEEVLWLLSRPEWVVCRVQKRGISGVERDAEICKQVARSESVKDDGLRKHLDMVIRAARMGSVQVHKNKREAWFQIHGRLLWYATQCDRTKRFVQNMEACAPHPWARASLGFLEQAGAAALQTIRVGREVKSVRMDGEQLGCCWLSRGTVGVTQYNITDGATKAQVQRDEGIRSYSFDSPDVSLSRDMKNVIAMLETQETLLWNIDTDVTKRIGSHLERGMVCMDLSDDGKMLVSGHADGTVQLWDARSGEFVGHALVGHENFVTCVAWSPDGSRIASTCIAGTMRVWDRNSGEEMHHPLFGNGHFLKCIAWSTDGSRIATGSSDGPVRVLDVDNGLTVGQTLVGHTKDVSCVAWSADNRRVVSGSLDRTLRVWDVGGGAAATQVLTGHLDMVQCATWSPCGTRIASGSDDLCVRVWDVGGSASASASVRQYGGHSGRVNCHALNRSKSRALTGSADRTLRMWDISKGTTVGKPFLGHTSEVRCVAWSMDETRAASGAADGSVLVWDVESQQAIGAPLCTHLGSVTCIMWSPDGKYIASGHLKIRLLAIGGMGLGGRDPFTWTTGGVLVWDSNRGTAVIPPLFCEGGVTCISLSLDGKYIAAVSGNGVDVWSVVSGKLAGPRFSPSDRVKDVRLSEDGSLVFSREEGGLQQIWRVVDGSFVATLDDERWDEAMSKQEQQGISAVAQDYWSPTSNEVTQAQPDGSTVVLGTCDSEIERLGDLWFSIANFGHCRVVE